MIDLDRTSDEISRENFVLSLKKQININYGPKLKIIYENKVYPKFKKLNKRSPKDRSEIRKEMSSQSEFQIWGSLWSSSQELMWEVIGDEIYRQIPQLNLRAKIRKPKGSLKINKNFKLPSYITSVDIHGMPGGYMLNHNKDDLIAGVYCEGAHRIYSKGQGVSMGGFKVMDILIQNLKQKYKNLMPNKILDIGCNIGRTSIAIKNNFPEAQVFGIDVSPGVIRYAHARSENLNSTINFSVQNGEKTDFKDNFFDLILSGTLLHETSFKAIYNIFKECHRVLKSGGIMSHLEVGVRNKDMSGDLYGQWYKDWSTHYNSEPFWGKFHDMDMIKPMLRGGFLKSNVWEDYINTPSGSKWWACGAQKK
ncbi:MAG: Ubiquinone/menaquinone biosynthesis C-methyltransferase UbiE [Alphaproteobacteria bacterium MarineAlpha2_Bin1]|nr:MAG: Ubiquinone/menaquinone biosynthesis C-methyltransferase UbiE [Alphaproteobacteria bacterium MarineAlpha2_Bin1]